MADIEQEPIHVAGRYCEVDSLAACVHAALSYWDRSVPYDYVAGLSGAAFSPGMPSNCVCAACRANHGPDIRLEFMGYALGFSVESAPVPAAPNGEDFAERARRASEDGAVILCSSWPCWSVLTRWNDDPSQLSLVPPSGLDHPCVVRSDSRLHILRQADKCLTPCEAFRAGLRFAADVACDQLDVDGWVYGTRPYEAWVRQLDTESFCPLGSTDGWECAERLGTRAVEAHLSAVRFLNRMHKFPAAVPHADDLNAATRAYAAIAARLAPYRNGCHLHQICERPEKRESYKRAVKKARELHRRAAEHLACVRDSL
jgi:hypothetical protein